MGLLKTILGSVFSNVEKTMKASVEDAIHSSNESGLSKDLQGYSASNIDTYTRSHTNKSNGHKNIDKEYFESILAEEFGEYEIAKDVNPMELGWTSAQEYVDVYGQYPCRNFDFVLKRDDKIAGVIMVTEHNGDNRAIHKNAAVTAENHHVPFINFFTQFPNERDYVVTRIKKNIAY